MNFRNLFLFIFLAACSTAISADLDTPHISVSGTATIQVTPNQMIWALSVRSLNPSSAGVASFPEK
jgi:uncharacterized protein YggE